MVVHPGGAAVVPVFSNGDVLLVEQFRYPMRQSLLELPAGKVDPGESPEETAARELEEEVGLQSGQVGEAGGILYDAGILQRATPPFSGSRPGTRRKGRR